MHIYLNIRSLSKENMVVTSGNSITHLQRWVMEMGSHLFSQMEGKTLKLTKPQLSYLKENWGAWVAQLGCS